MFIWTDEKETEPLEASAEIETEPHAWDEEDEGDRRYDLMVEDALDPQTHADWMHQYRMLHPASATMPDIESGTPAGMEPESERARRRAPIYGRVA